MADPAQGITSDPDVRIDPQSGIPIITIRPSSVAGQGGWAPYAPPQPQGGAPSVAGSPQATTQSPAIVGSPGQSPAPAPGAPQGDATGGWAPYTAPPPSNAPQPTQGEALVRSTASGATLGFAPAIEGLSGASGMDTSNALSDQEVDLPALGRAVASPFVGAYNMATGQPGAVDAYNQARQDALDAQERAAAAYPKTYLAGEIGSSLALPLGAASGGATAAARVGKSALAGSIGGAGFGAGTATSEGESPMGVGERAAGGAAAGALLGGALGGAVDTASHVGRRVASVIRAGVNPEREATRISQGAFTGPGQAKAIGQRLNDQAALKAGGEADTPVTIGDFAGAPAHARLRSAANISPEAREHVGEFVQSRYEQQSARFATWLRSKFGGADNAATRDTLKEAAKRALDPRYKRAYKLGEFIPLNEQKELLRLAGAPSVQGAINGAVPRMKDRGIIQGFKVPRQNPLVQKPNGTMTPRVDANGNTSMPDLAFWDQVVRNLNGEIGEKLRAGNNERASELIQLNNAIKTELDRLVPSYREARAGAHTFFSAEDALEAGENFVTDAGITNPEAARAFATMSPVEQRLFAHGFAGRLADLIEAKGDSANVLNNMFLKSRRARQRINIALGTDGAAQMEALMRIEGLVDRTRKATVGNSTTTQQLSDHGLIGGIGISELAHSLNPIYWVAGALVLGGRAAAREIDEKVALHVAHMLLSDDPAVLSRGYQIVTRNPVFRDALRRASDIGTRQLINYIGPSGVGAGALAAYEHFRPETPSDVANPSHDQQQQYDADQGVQ